MKFTLGIGILGMICLLSLLVKALRLHRIRREMEQFIKTRSITEFKRVAFLKDIVNDYQQYVKLNRKDFDTKLLIRRFYGEDRIAVLPAWLLDSIIYYGTIILILVGLAGSISQLLQIDLQTKNQIHQILWPTFFSLGISICIFVIQMILGIDIKREKILTRLEEYMDNHYRFHIESDIQRNDPEFAEEADAEARIRKAEVAQGKAEQVYEDHIPWETIEKGIGNLETILANLEENLEPVNKINIPSLEMDEIFIEEIIHQVLQGN